MRQLEIRVELKGKRLKGRVQSPALVFQNTLKIKQNTEKRRRDAVRPSQSWHAVAYFQPEGVKTIAGY